MAKSVAARAARKPVLVHPASTSRIARASVELMGPLPGDATLTDEEILSALDTSIQRFGVRPIIKALETRKSELMERLVGMVKREGEEDDKGKIRYETELHRFQIIDGENVYLSEKLLRVAMTACGITPKVQAKILRAKGVRKVTPYEYVGTYRKSSADVAQEGE